MGLVQYIFNCHMSHTAPRLFEFKKTSPVIIVCIRMYIFHSNVLGSAVAEVVFHLQSVLYFCLRREESLKKLLTITSARGKVTFENIIGSLVLNYYSAEKS